ncbi:hypothetical protein [Streptomyces sp. NPDC088350]|uniref:hypothetical protein n=1 Tax=Streptomyces sp. NPDC088350 TaxID=3365854 RepID=UPI003805A33A
MDPLGNEEARHQRPERQRLRDATEAFGGRYSPGSTSSSDTADVRDFAESSLDGVRLNQVDNGTRPTYVQREEGDSIDYDPSTFEGGYGAPGGSRTLGSAQSVAVHEATHGGVTNSFDNHVGDFSNMNLPRDDTAFQESAARQMAAVTSNMQNVGYLASIDGKISSRTREIVGQPAREFLERNASGGVGYAQALAHAEYVSVIAELKTEIKHSNPRSYRDSPTYRYLTRLNEQIRPARISGQGEIQPVQARISTDQMTSAARREHGGPSSGHASSSRGGSRR